MNEPPIDAEGEAAVATNSNASTGQGAVVIASKMKGAELVGLFIYRLLRLAQIDCKPSEVKRRRYDAPRSRPAIRPEFVNSENVDALSDYSDAVYKQYSDRLKRIDDKLGRLLSLGGVATTLLGGFSLAGTVFYMIPVLVLLASMLVVAFGLSLFQYEEVVLSNADVASHKQTLLVEIATAKLGAAESNHCTLDLLADCYRAALRYIVTAIILVPLAFGASRVWNPHLSAHDEFVARLRRDHELRELLRGPPGSVGAAGPQGPQGANGPPGAPGPAGRCQCVDAGAVGARRRDAE